MEVAPGPAVASWFCPAAADPGVELIGGRGGGWRSRRGTLSSGIHVAGTQLGNHLVSAWRKSDGVYDCVGDSKRRQTS